MAISVVQSLSASSGAVASLQSSAFGSPVTTGSTIIATVAMYANANDTITVTDTAGNTYTRDAFLGDISLQHQRVEVWRCTNCTGGSTFKVTASIASGTAYFNLGAMEVSGLAASPVDAASAGDNGSGTTADTGSWTTTNADDLLVAVMVNNDGASAITSPAGFTSFARNTNASQEPADAAYQIVSATQSGINPQWTAGSATWYGIGVAYKMAAASGVHAPWYYTQLSGGTFGMGC